MINVLIVFFLFLPAYAYNAVNEIQGNMGSATGAKVMIEGDDSIITRGDGAKLTISVSGTMPHAVQIGNNSGSLKSLAQGTAGQVLTSSGPGMDPSFESLPNSSADEEDIKMLRQEINLLRSDVNKLKNLMRANPAA